MCHFSATFMGAMGDPARALIVKSARLAVEVMPAFVERTRPFPDKSVGYFASTYVS
jgi:hypothetical protein